ncbi:MAG: amidohydrolase family protein [Desulfobacteraceae bacterium]|nr:amidohydrolase family protein [Desulfobacteraceae bacterium]
MKKKTSEKTMIVDCHTHFLPLPGNDLLKELKRAKITHAVVMIIPSKITITKKGDYALDINDTTLKSLEDDNCRLGKWSKNVEANLLPFAWLDYRMKDVVSFFENLVVHYNFKGLKIHQVFNGPADERYYELVNKATELDVPVIIHTGFREPAYAQNIGILASQFPQGKFICAHLLEEFGLNNKSDFLRLANNHDNVYFECSYVRHPRRLRELTEGIGSHRILFGSDFPFGAKDIKWDLTKVLWAEIDHAAKEKILWKNAAALFKL